jgi:hypothetical protein
MTQEEKSLLLQDLCARLPYDVYVEHITTKVRGKLKGIVFEHIYNDTDSIQDINAWVIFFGDEYIDATYFRPILRPLSSMTEKEKKEYELLCDYYMDDKEVKYYFNNIATIDWYHQKHFDCRGLIKLGLALEASEGMYNIKEK